MKISVASGKGGTGKTTVSVNLALTIGNLQYIDCDVEDPDGHLFLKPQITNVSPVNVNYPKVIHQRCTYCGKCADFCAYNAIIVFSDQWLITQQMCKDCGGCYIICPEKALASESRQIGSLSKGTAANNITFIKGDLKTGEAMATPLIKKVKEEIFKDMDAIIDCPPGTSCSMINSVDNTDFCLLVTEPTPFGLHDLKSAIKVSQILSVPCGVVINKSGLSDNKLIYECCSINNVPVLMEIPFDKDLSIAYSKGIPAIYDSNKWQRLFIALYEKIKSQIGAENV